MWHVYKENALANTKGSTVSLHKEEQIIDITMKKNRVRLLRIISHADSSLLRKMNNLWMYLAICLPPDDIILVSCCWVLMFSKSG